MLTYRFRICPTAAQARITEETLETCRRLYNSMLADRMEKRTGFYNQKKMLVELKHDDKHLKSVHSQVLQDVVLRLDKAYQEFFAGLSRYPKFRRSGRYNSFTYPQSGFRGDTAGHRDQGHRPVVRCAAGGGRSQRGEVIIRGRQGRRRRGNLERRGPQRWDADRQPTLLERLAGTNQIAPETALPQEEGFL